MASEAKKRTPRINFIPVILAFLLGASTTYIPQRARGLGRYTVDDHSLAATTSYKQAIPFDAEFTDLIQTDEVGGSNSRQQQLTRIASNDIPRMTVDYHTNRFQYKSWCSDRSQCNHLISNHTFGTELCYPCQRRWLILICSGRSGSTTLTEMMNLLPGVRMSGENSDSMTLFTNLESLVMGHVRYPPRPSGAWRHNAIPQESWSCVAQKLLETINPPNLNQQGERIASDEGTILGFKTIRLFKDDLDRNSDGGTEWKVPPKYIRKKIRILRHLFPCARFVGNIRSDEKAQLKSRKVLHGWHDDETFVPRERMAITEVIRELGPEQGFLLDGSSWQKNVSEINDLVDWLGFSRECHFKELLGFNKAGGKTDGLSMNPNCRYLY